MQVNVYLYLFAQTTNGTGMQEKIFAFLPSHHMTPHNLQRLHMRNYKTKHPSIHLEYFFLFLLQTWNSFPIFLVRSFNVAHLFFSLCARLQFSFTWWILFQFSCYRDFSPVEYMRLLINTNQILK